MKKRFLFQLDSETARALARLAKLEERPKSAIIRRLIKSAAQAIEKPPQAQTQTA